MDTLTDVGSKNRISTTGACCYGITVLPRNLEAIGPLPDWLVCEKNEAAGTLLWYGHLAEESGNYVTQSEHGELFSIPRRYVIQAGLMREVLT